MNEASALYIYISTEFLRVDGTVQLINHDPHRLGTRHFDHERRFIIVSTRVVVAPVVGLLVG